MDVSVSKQARSPVSPPAVSVSQMIPLKDVSKRTIKSTDCVSLFPPFGHFLAVEKWLILKQFCVGVWIVLLAQCKLK